MNFFNQTIQEPNDNLKKNVCPDGGSCSDVQTCCLSISGEYGCCPDPKAVCCSDNLHCCPRGTMCNLNQGTCNTVNETITYLMERKILIHIVKSIICQDNRSQCDNDQTCCILRNGSYACCPSPNAVCCSDMVHCCPYRTHCNLNKGTCDDYRFPFKPTKSSCLMHKL